MDVEAVGRAAAERFRRDHNLGAQPLGDLVTIIEQTTGIDVAVLDAEPGEHGLTMWDPQRGVTFIGVAKTPHPMRQRSTLAHELGHVLFRTQDVAGTPRHESGQAALELEDLCRAFARHVLAPVEGVRQVVGAPNSVTQATLSAVVQRFLVSPAIAAIVMEQAGYLDPDHRQVWSMLHTPQLAARYGWIDQYHAMQADSNRTRAPQRLLARAISGYAEGVLPVQAIATLRGTPASEVESELHAAGVEPPELVAAWASGSDLPEVDVDFTELDAADDASPDVRGTA